MTRNKVLFAIIIGIVLSIWAAYANAASANAYKATKVSTTSVIVSCNDEREPVLTKLENTTAVILTCKLTK